MKRLLRNKRVLEISDERDAADRGEGLFVYLVKGWQRYAGSEIHHIHAGSVSDAIKKVRAAVRCECDSCFE